MAPYCCSNEGFFEGVFRDLVSSLLISRAEGSCHDVPNVLKKLRSNVESFSDSMKPSLPLLDHLSKSYLVQQPVGTVVVGALTKPTLSLVKRAAGGTFVDLLQRVKDSPRIVSASSVFVAAASVYDTARNTLGAISDIKAVEDVQAMVGAIEELVGECEATLDHAERLINGADRGTNGSQLIHDMTPKLDGEIQQADLKFQAFLHKYEAKLADKKTRLETKATRSNQRGVVKGILGALLLGTATVFTGGTVLIVASSGLLTSVAGSLDLKTAGDCQEALNDLSKLNYTVDYVRNFLRLSRERRDLLVKRLLKISPKANLLTLRQLTKQNTVHKERQQIGDRTM